MSPDATGTAAPRGAAVHLRGITKRFPAVVANDRVEFEAAEGEVHALLGENGAGKSTLSNILTGLYRPDEGEILLYGRPVEFHSPRDALQAGICMVHQHFRLVPPFTVAENVILGDPGDEGRKFLVHPRHIERRVAELGERYRIAVDPREHPDVLVGEQPAELGVVLREVRAHHRATRRDPHRPRDRGGRVRVVTGDHQDPDARAAAASDGRRDLGPDRILEPDEAQEREPDLRLRRRAPLGAAVGQGTPYGSSAFRSRVASNATRAMRSRRSRAGAASKVRTRVSTSAASRLACAASVSASAWPRLSNTRP